MNDEEKIKKLEKKISLLKGKLQENELHYKRLSENSFEAIFLSEKGICIDQNLTAGKMFGYSMEEAIGRPGTDWIHPGFRDKVKENMMSGYEAPYEAVAIRKDGSTFPCEIQGKMLTAAKKKIRITAVRDISDRDSARKALLASQARFKEITDLLPQPVWETDIKGNFIYSNKTGLKLMGYTEEDLKKEISYLEIIAPKDRERIKENLLKKKEGINVGPNEYVCIRKDGSTFPAIIYASPIFINGEFIGMRGITLDISHRKQTEALLQKNLVQQELLSEIALELNKPGDFKVKMGNIIGKIGVHTNVSRVYIFENSEDGENTSNTFEWCNLDIDGQKDELQDIPYDVIPSWRDILIDEGLVYSEDISNLPEDVRAILEPQEIKSIIVYPLNVYGKFFGFIGFDECVHFKEWNKSELELLRTIAGMIANAFQRHLSEESLKESESRNRAILESIPDLLFQINREGKIISFRNSSKDELAFEPGFFLNKNITEIFDPEFGKQIKSAVIKSLKEGSCKFEYELEIKGKKQDFEARMSRMSNTEVIAIIRNVSEIKEYERELKNERDKANRANQFKTDFLSTMSHEIRTPLNAVVGLTNILLMESPKKSQIPNLTTLKFSSQNLLNIINDILDYNKLSGNKVILENIDFNIYELLKGMHFSLNNMAKNKNIDLDYQIDKEIPEILVGDSTRLLQVINNLVSNAIKFTYEGGVTVLVKLLSRTNKRVDLEFFVKDTGIGIEEENIESIFEDFKQASTSTTREYGGTGLGLAIVKKILNVMNSKIKVKSAPGKGSTFYFSINLQIGEKQKDDNLLKKTINKISLKDKKVLLVEDNKVNQMIARIFLDEWKCITEVAENGEIAVRKVQEKEFDIILMDLQMPVMDGYEASQKIKKMENRKYADLPIVALSASALGEIENRTREYGMDDFVVKPFVPEHLFSVLDKHVNG